MFLCQNSRIRAVSKISIVSLLFLIFVLSCYKGHGLGPEPPEGEIQGRIEFVGQWPDSTREVRVIVLNKYPSGITDLLLLFGFVQNNYVAESDTIRRNSRFYDYSIKLSPGEYEWVLVAWFPDIKSYFLGVKELGAYYIDPDQLLPSPVVVNADEITSNIDIVADFSNVDREEPFFKK